MRWLWRGFAALGVAALVGLVVYGVIAQVRLHQEVAHICRQFSTVDCKHHEDAPFSTPAYEPRLEQLEDDVRELCYSIFEPC